MERAQISLAHDEQASPYMGQYILGYGQSNFLNIWLVPFSNGLCV